MGDIGQHDRVDKQVLLKVLFFLVAALLPNWISGTSDFDGL